MLNSGVVIKPVASGIMFSISVTFVLGATLVAELMMSNILPLTSVTFIFRGVFVVRLVISGILISNIRYFALICPV